MNFPFFGGTCAADHLIPLRYLFVGLDTAVQVFATATSRLLRTLQMEAGQKVVGYQLCPIESAVLYIFTSGFVTKWDWDSGKRLARWGTDATTVALDLSVPKSRTQPLSYSIVTSRDGKRQILINALGEKKLAGVCILTTTEAISSIKVASSGRVVVACDGAHIFLGHASEVDIESPESVQFSWREATLPASATCFHLRENSDESQASSHPVVDLAVGQVGGYILAYQDILSTLFIQPGEKKSSPRKLHWHRGAVSSVRWSRDGKGSEWCRVGKREHRLTRYFRQLPYFGWPRVRSCTLAIRYRAQTVPPSFVLPYLQYCRVSERQLLYCQARRQLGHGVVCSRTTTLRKCDGIATKY